MQQSSSSQCCLYSPCAGRCSLVAITVALAALLIVAWPSTSRAVDYDIEILYQSGDIVDGVELGGNNGGPGIFSDPSINASGDILWYSPIIGSNNHLFLNDRVVFGPTQPLRINEVEYSYPWGNGGYRGDFNSASEWITIAGTGFSDAFITSTGEVLAQSPGSLDGHDMVGFSNFFEGVDRNDSGDVVIGAAFPVPGGRNQFITLNGSTIAMGGDVIDDRTLGFDVSPYGPVFPQINNNRDVLYVARTEIGLTIFLNDRVLYEPGQNIGSFVLEDTSKFQHRLNNRGDVAWLGQLNDPTNNEEAFWALLINEEIVARSGSLLDGEMIDFPARSVAFNDRGEILFSAVLDDGREALFTNAGLIAKEGGSIGGMPFPENSFTTLGASPLNNAGEFIFAIGDRDGVIPSRLFRGRIPVPELEGDFDNDGDTDGNDFLTWQRGELPTPLSQSDLADWEANFGAAASLSANSSQVPEPATGFMLMLGAAVVMFTGGRTTVSKPIR